MFYLRHLGFSCAAPSVNMAADEGAFDRAVLHPDRATLRFFAFDRRCVSIGRNQRVRLLPPGMLSDGIEVVRRPTGGGAVLHDGDLCYSLVMPEAYLDRNGSLLASYRLITDGIRRGFGLCGVALEYGHVENGPIDALCFDNAMTHELTLHGKKLVGSAQRRAKGVLLQQGSIMDVHHVPRERLIRALSDGLKASLCAEYVYGPLTPEEIAGAACPAA